MAKKSIHELLKDTFQASSKKEWQKAASSEIEGKNPNQALRWKSSFGIDFEAYYEKSETELLDYLKEFLISPSDEAYFGPRTWYNLPKVTVASD
ncbi:MAG: hypothetical protein L0Y35_07585, partial [Flammeovirgaceae bacterium]|nr:hypothetical protein [Flammeovirgaceae bacterium]